MPSIRATLGSSYPLGTQIHPHGIQFSFYAQTASATLLFFQPKAPTPFLSLPLSSSLHKTGEIWHVLVEGLEPPIEYSIITDQSPHPLVDPYAKALSLSGPWRQNPNYQPRAYCDHLPPFDWQNITRPALTKEKLLIYEMHLKGFTRHPSSATNSTSAFIAMIEKIPHLVSLGINAVELLPILEFNEEENPLINPYTQEKLCNFWGYSPLHFFCLMQRYGSLQSPFSALQECKTLVRELHRHGIAVILDVVYNHTGEGGERGITQSLKGLHKKAYYLWDEKENYANFSGTGNTLSCNHPITTKLIVDSLEYLASELHIDGFRFDLASIFCRGEKGEVLDHPPVIEAIERSPLLQNCFLFAETWDAAGLYQVGSFPGNKLWSEWNGKYRDTVRSFLKGTPGMAAAFADALCGSASLYGAYTPIRSTNFLTVHDGYTLQDLVSYQEKHNEENGEHNRDGTNDHRSWNCGIEGPTEHIDILLLRERQRKNFLLALNLSLGVPLFSMGDEYGHTRHGNNNPYCHDTEINYFRWDLLAYEKDFLRFYHLCINLRKTYAPILCQNAFLTPFQAQWYGLVSAAPNWGEDSHFICCILQGSHNLPSCLVVFHACNKPNSWNPPPPPIGKKWHRIIDTSLASPEDFMEELSQAPPLISPYTLQGYSAIVALALEENLP